MKTARPYRMQARASATEATRRRILEAAFEAFRTEWFDEVTLAGVARAAGVSQQTVLNHFGGKDGLFGAVVDLGEAKVQEVRYAAPPGDVARALELLVEDYEATGDAVVRLLALEGRVDAVAPMLARGRAGHRAWVEHVFGPGARVPALVVATDVYTWKLLRRDQALSREDTIATMRTLVEGVLADPTPRRSG